jgi:hypothetical protein
MAARSKKTPDHRVDYRHGSDKQVEEILIWHGEQCLFHLKRMAPGFVFLATYVNGASNHVEIKAEAGEITLRDSQIADKSPAAKSKKKKDLALDNGKNADTLPSDLRTETPEHHDQQSSSN